MYWGYLGELDIFNQPHGNLRACPLGESVRARSRCSPSNDTRHLVVFGALLILVMPNSGLLIDLREIEAEATP